MSDRIIDCPVSVMLIAGDCDSPIPPTLKMIAVEPELSPVLSGGTHRPHPIQGIGAGFIPGVLNVKMIDEVIQVTDEAAFEMARRLAKEEGIFAGTSSGLNVTAALQLAQELGRGSTVATVAVDTGFKYLAGDLYQT